MCQLRRDGPTGLILAKDEIVAQWTAEIDDPLLALQEALHSMLAKFLNATDLPPARAIVPLRYARIPRSRKAHIAAAAARDLGVDTKYLAFVASHTSSTDLELANAIAEGYGILRNKFAQRKSPTPIHVDGGIDRDEWIKAIQTKKYQPILDFVSRVADSDVTGISSFWLHGSFATLDFMPGYSDCDATVIIDGDSCTDAVTLVSMRNKMSRISSSLHSIDPLQHHGLFVTTEYDLLCYQQSFFPLQIIERSVEILKDASGIDYVECGLGYSSEKAIILKMAQLMRSVVYGDIHLRTAYAIKAHLQTLILMWVIYLQIRDEKFWHKKDALCKKPDEIPSEIWSIIENITLLRREWNPNIRVPYLHVLGLWNPRLPPAFLRAISVFYAKGLSKRLVRGWENDCMRLSEFLIADLRSMGKL
ncbi:MAG: hypothetical protein IH948_09920 [Bacteroidetes bacterium]|nr:hypothetical protein [Bacteroidota bacterium]